MSNEKQYCVSCEELIIGKERYCVICDDGPFCNDCIDDDNVCLNCSSVEDEDEDVEGEDFEDE